MGPESRAKAKIGWFSTWNCKCGVAEYSRHLLDHFDSDRFDWTVLASYDDQALGPDGANVVRCWGINAGSVRPLLEAVNAGRFDVLVVQYKIQLGFGWLSLKHFEALVALCHLIGTRVIVVAHATDGADLSGRPVSSRMRAALATVQRILVHCDADVERLRAFGLSANVELIAHGFPEIVAHDGQSARARLGMPQESLVIGAYGFMLPAKGIDTLIEAFSDLRSTGMDARLLLVNAMYPHPVSQDCLATCENVANERGVRDRVVFETSFLSDDESAELLTASDVVVFPYRSGMDSSSAAVRVGLASGRPVLCTPASIFSDVAPIVHFFDGFAAEDISNGLQSFLGRGGADEALSRRQAAWVEEHSRRNVSLRLQGLIGTPAPSDGARRVQAWVGGYLEDLVTEQSADEVAHDRIRGLEQALRESHQAAESIGLELDKASSTLQHTRTALEQADASLRQARASIDQSNADLRAVQASRSWRVTAPLRFCEAMLRTWLRGAGQAEAPQPDAPQPDAPRPGGPANDGLPVADSARPATNAEDGLSAEARDVRRDLERMAERRKW